MTIPNAVFRVGILIFTDEGKRDGESLVGVKDLNGCHLDCLPLSRAAVVYWKEFGIYREKRGRKAHDTPGSAGDRSR
jgi:hypothetical protein